MQKILEDEGIELYKSSDKYFLRYDAGEFAVKMKNLEITAEEAKNVMNDPGSAYNIILAYHDKGIYGEN